MYRELKKLTSSKINEPIKKWSTELNRTFSKKSKWPKKNMKKCSPSLAIKEMQIKTLLNFQLTPVSLPTTNVSEDVGGRNPHTLLMRM
jgi:hypothetical protein